MAEIVIGETPPEAFAQYMMQRRFDDLRGVLIQLAVLMGELQARWCGQKVRLLDDLTSRDAEGQVHVLVPGGAIGTIVEVRQDPEAPFMLKFDDFPHKLSLGIMMYELVSI